MKYLPFLATTPLTKMTLDSNLVGRTVFQRFRANDMRNEASQFEFTFPFCCVEEIYRIEQFSISVG